VSGPCWETAQLVSGLLEKATVLLTDWTPVPCASCDLDDHPFGEHYMMLDDLDRERALWARWSGDEMTLVSLRYCESLAPGASADACWLFTGHRGGHTWERYQ
jgi:hypothetical protein